MTCPPCTHDCNEGRNCPTGKGNNMTKEALAQEQEPYALESLMYSNDRIKVDPVTGNVSIGTPQRTEQ